MTVRRAAPWMVAATLCLLGLELGIRLILFTSLASPIRAAALARDLFEQYGSDEFYRLALRLHIRGREQESGYPKFDPLLGWTAERSTPENPLGLAAGAQRWAEALRSPQTIVFLGDSFVAGLTSPVDSIPEQLAQRLPGWTVLNAGVPGYGVDQMALSLDRLLERLRPTHVVVGVFYNDIDRVIFEVQSSPKPWFTVDDGQLALHRVVPPTPFARWLDAYAPRSWLFAAAVPQNIVYRFANGRWAVEHAFWLHPSETTRGRNEKREIVSRLVRRMRDACAARGVRLSIVLFPYREHLVQEGWYEPFMRRLLYDERIPYVDLKPPLARRVSRRHLDWQRDVYRRFEHPNAAENALFAGEIATFLRRTYGYAAGQATTRVRTTPQVATGGVPTARP